MENLEELKNIIEQEENIEDEGEEEEFQEDEDACVRYDVTSYGIDFDVEGLIRRLNKNEIFIPEFQRKYVWKMPEASRLIESLLLGLPVPGIFLAKDQETGKMLVIDGQQRLLSLKFFMQGEFNPIESAKIKRVFRLTKVKNKYNGKTYAELDPRDRTNLDNAVLHATVVKQESPQEDDTSIYHIFERLNSGGKKLTAQEIRAAVYHGKLMDLIKNLNEIPEWRKIFGVKNDRMKDEELILRFLAMERESKTYSKPMVEFINKFCSKHRTPSKDQGIYFKSIFEQTIKLFNSAIEEKLFRPSRALNVAFFESCMVGLASRLSSKKEISNQQVRDAYHGLLNNKSFLELISQSTTDAKNIRLRLNIAIDAFSLE